MLFNVDMIIVLVPSPPRFKLVFYHYTSENVTLEIQFNKKVRLQLI